MTMERLDTMQSARTEAPNGGAKRGPRTEIEKLQEALKTVDSAIETLKQAINTAGACKIPGMDVKRNLGGKLAALLKETGLAVPRGAKA